MSQQILKIDRKKGIAGILIILIGFLFALLLHITGILEFLEMKTFDARMEYSDKDIKANEDIVVLLVDEASLQSMKPLVGRWPWPRSLYADLIEFLTVSGARAVLFDVLFTEPQVPRTPEGELGMDDFMLVDMTAASGICVHAAQFLMDTEDEINKTLLNRPLPEFYVEKFAISNLTIKPGAKINQANNYYLPFEELWQVSDRVGIVEFRPDDDGIYRRSHLIRQYQDNYYPVISLSFVNKEMPPDSIVLEKRRLILGEREVPLEKDGTYLINMKKNFNTFSIGGVFASIQKMRMGEYDQMLVQPEEFENKIVILGASAAGIEDLKHTSTGAGVPGVLLHGSIISNLLDEDYIHRGSELMIFAIVFIACVIIAFTILGFQSMVLQAAVPAVIAVIYSITGFYLLDEYRILIPIVIPLVAFGSVFTGSFIYVSATEGKERRKTKKMLSQYVSPTVLSEVFDKGKDVLTPEVGAAEELSILFSDVRSFTSFSEMVEVEQVVEQLNYYLSDMVEVVFKHEGTLDKFIGDAVMAFWGAPIITDTHAKQSVTAALEMIQKLEDVNKHFDEKGYPHFKIGVGIHTGKVILGNIGSERKLDYTVIGDGVNLASRMEGLTKNYGCEILISESTFEQIKQEIPCRVIDAVRVKGKERPIRIYQPLASQDMSKEEFDRGTQIADLSEQAFSAYQNQEFEKSISLYKDIQGILVDDKASEIVIMRCNEFLKEPPPENWDGCYTMKTK